MSYKKGNIPWIKGRPLSDGHKRKIGEGNKGKVISPETLKKMSEANKGKHHSPSTEFKKGHKKGMTGKHHSLEARQKMSIATKGKPRPWLKGKKYTEERKRKMSEAHKRLGIIPPSRKGVTLTKEHKRKISESHKGEKAYQWLGGKSFEPYGLKFNKKLKEQIRKRDNYKCRECGHQQVNIGYKLHCHHIDYDKKNNDQSNLISLCRNCHAQTNFDRKDWTNYFKMDSEFGSVYR